MSAEAPGFAPAQLADEERGRANCYALIGRLFYDAPDASLLAEVGAGGAITTEPGRETDLTRSWSALQGACRNAFPALVKQEYDDLFISVGRAPVSLYTSYYLRDISGAQHLVKLRQRLDQLGLARRATAFEAEDHVSGLCDVMRFLIEQNQSLFDQRRFFEEFVYPGVGPLCIAVETAVSANLYKNVALFGRVFLDVENAAFEMAT